MSEFPLQANRVTRFRAPIFSWWLLSISLLLCGSLPKTARGQSGSRGQAESQIASGTSREVGVLVFKLRPEVKRAAHLHTIEHAVLLQALAAVGASELTQQFPRAVAAPKERSAEGVDLTLLYRINYRASLPFEQAQKLLQASGAVAYVEPLYRRELLFQPNDLLADSTRIVTQYHLKNIRAYQAWDVEQGDTTIVIGLTDTGTQFTHQDLQGQFAINYADPINGIDDDNDGYVDNYRGWDVADNDNNPSVENINTPNSQAKHGVLVSGALAARTNNGKGVAGAGFRCRFMPIKVFAFNSTGHFAGFEGIVYAADHGCHVINCSWGGAGWWSQYEQDVITYATVNRNAVVVAAAGNTNADLNFSPASYKGVLSVAALERTGVKGSTNTYAYRVSVSAPGKQVLTTGYNTDSSYAAVGGSSFASPLVAATAALVRHRFPTLTAAQVVERVRVTANPNIYALAGNADYQEKLGYGQLDMFRAVADTAARSVRATAVRFTRPGSYSAADTVPVEVMAGFRNYLAPLNSLTVTVTASSPNVQILDDTYSTGSVGTMVTTSTVQPFRLRLLPDTMSYRVVCLRFAYNDGAGYSDYEYITMRMDSIRLHNSYATPTTPLSFSPPTGFPGDTVTITGPSLNGATMVKFNAATSPSFTVVSPTQINAVVPSGATTGKVSLITADSTVISASNFTVMLPTVTSIAPKSGVVGASITIRGTHLLSVTSVALNGVAVPGVTLASDTSITFTVPSGATTGKVSVTAPRGTATSIGIFSVLLPSLSSFTPTSAVVGASVTITGTNLTGATGVKFNGTDVTSFTLNSATSITTTVPSGATTGPLSVTTGGGTVTSATAFAVLAPTITRFWPSTGAATGTTVTLTGYNFTGATRVTFNGEPASSFTVVSATSITVSVPGGATIGLVSVTTPSGTGTCVSIFKVLPVISSFTATSGFTGDVVTLTGTGFTGATAVKFNTTSVSTFTVVDAKTITATVPAGATTGRLYVTTPGGTAFSATYFTVRIPTITGFTPSAGGAVGTSVIIMGTNLSGATSVMLNGAALPSYSIVSATSIATTVPASATTGRFSVITPTGTGTSAGIFKVLPVISSLSQAGGAPGSVLTITGTGFTGATVVKFCTVVAPGFTVVSSTTIMVPVPVGALTGKVYVTTAGGAAASTAIFAVAPTIRSFTPGTGSAGSVVIITGLNFTSATTLAFNGVNAVKVYNSATQLTATVPASATTGLLTVSDAGGITNSATTYTITTGPAPTITSCAPTLNVGAGTVVTITGSNLTGATAVIFNTTTTTAVTVLSATQVQATVPAGATTGLVYVVTPNGTAKSAASLSIIQAPTVTSLAPASGSPGALTLIGGANYVLVTSVKFNGVEAASFSVNSAAQIAAVVPAGATTGKVSVTAVGGTGVSTATFTVTSAPVPTITGISPATGIRGSSVVLTGTDFTGVTAIKLGTVTLVSGTGYTVNSPTQITLSVPATAITGKFFVTAGGGMRCPGYAGQS